MPEKTVYGFCSALEKGSTGAEKRDRVRSASAQFRNSEFPHFETAVQTEYASVALSGKELRSTLTGVAVVTADNKRSIFRCVLHELRQVVVINIHRALYMVIVEALGIADVSNADTCFIK